MAYNLCWLTIDPSLASSLNTTTGSVNFARYTLCSVASTDRLLKIKPIANEAIHVWEPDAFTFLIATLEMPEVTERIYCCRLIE